MVGAAPNHTLQQTAAAMFSSRGFQAVGAAAAAELGRWARKDYFPI